MASSPSAADIIGYRATCTSTNGGTARTGVGTGGIIVVTTLTGPNSIYNCSVAAITAAADGPASTAVSVTTF